MDFSSFRKTNLADFLDMLARDVPTLPAGGSAAALTGALAAAMGKFVAQLSFRRAKKPEARKTFSLLSARFDELRESCLEMMDQDAKAYEKIISALKMPKATKAEQTGRKAALEAANISASEPPTALAVYALEMLHLNSILIEKGYGPATADAKVAAEIAHACLCAALQIAQADISEISDPVVAEKYQKKLSSLQEQGGTRYRMLKQM